MKKLLMMGLYALVCRNEEAILLEKEEEFSKLNPSHNFDLIIADPSNENGQYICQVKTLFERLHIGGQLQVLVPEDWITGKSEEEKSFKKFVEANGFYYTFKSKLKPSFRKANSDDVLLMLNKKG